MKNKKKRTKKYKGKYVTADRVDMSKGGRVGYQKGKRVRDLNDPTGQTFLDPKDVPNMKVGNQEPRNNTPAPPIENRAAPTTFQQAPIESKRPDVVQPKVISKQPITPPQQERFIENIDNVSDNIDTTFRQAPTSTGKGSERMFIGREGEVRPQAGQASQAAITTVEDGNIGAETNQRGRGRGGEPWWKQRGYRSSKEAMDDGWNYSKDAGTWVQSGTGGTDTGEDSKFNVGDTKIVNGFLHVYTPNGWVNTGTKPGENNNQEQEEVEKELVTARGRAEQILQGDMTGIPMAEAPQQVEVGELGEAKTMEEREALEAETAEIEAAPEAATIEDVETVKTPEQLQAETYRAEQVGVTPDVELSQGEIQENALAKAAKVDRVAPIEGVEVEIPEGALAERVVGVISEGAKATAAINAGTSLSRITRAKKQLSRAGLSDEDIQEIGNDPEALEDRLADFSEEQRGIIEGLPEEALVSTQINGLLEGMENGEIPTWARPAVAQVEQMLARRGMSASTVGRDSLFNAIIQSAMPIAQSNAQAIQQSVSQQKTIEAQTAEANAQRVQQTALTNAQNVFNMDMAQFNADQQTSLSNSKFMQTVGITNANNAQQATIQNAVLMSQANLAEADFYQKAQINNANAFLNMDLTNLNNAQQVNVLKAQQEQQRLLSNQAANNAAAQFNATSENQTRQFMSGLNAQIEQFNVAQLNSSEQFNVQQQNARDALEFQVEADLEKANAAMVNQINQFNEQVAFDRDKFNTANAQQIEQSNLAWRRQANTINTAAANQVAMQNVQNAFNMTSQAQSFLWQELRDQADFAFRAAEGKENREAQLYATALANESESAKNWDSTLKSVGTLINALKG
jgi:hypothetical protein